MRLVAQPGFRPIARTPNLIRVMSQKKPKSPLPIAMSNVVIFGGHGKVCRHISHFHLLHFYFYYFHLRLLGLCPM